MPDEDAVSPLSSTSTFFSDNESDMAKDVLDICIVRANKLNLHAKNQLPLPSIDEMNTDKAIPITFANHYTASLSHVLAWEFGCSNGHEHLRIITHSLYHKI